MISHQNVIANVLQIKYFEKQIRDQRPEHARTEVALGLLPLSHIYGLVVIAQASTYRGDGIIILPKFELQSFLNAIQTQKIQTLNLVSARLREMNTTSANRAGPADHHPADQESTSLLQV